MEKEYIENLRIVAKVGGNKISQQNLHILREKYHLADAEMVEMREYCKQHSILIYNEEEHADSIDRANTLKQRNENITLTETEKSKLKKARHITRHIMHLAATRARKRVKGQGWLCGTYTSGVRKYVERYVMRTFNEDEMDYIIGHLPTENEEDTCFLMVDVSEPQRIMYYNDMLNSVIPRLHINHFYSDIFE